MMQKLTHTRNTLCIITIALCTLSTYTMEQKIGDTTKEEITQATNPQENHTNRLVLVEQVGPLKIYYRSDLLGQAQELIERLLPEETRQRLLELEAKHTRLLPEFRRIDQMMHNQPVRDTVRDIQEIIDDLNMDNEDNPIDPVAWEKLHQ